MKKFFISLAVFTLVFFFYDKLYLIVANLSAETEVDKRLESLVKGETNKDVIIVGASTGSRDIIASQIEDSLGISVYNLCYPGSNVEFHEFIFRTLVTFNELPKLILFVVDEDVELIETDIAIFRYDRLYPLVKYPYILKEFIDRGDKDALLSRLLVLHRLNKANFDLRQKRFTPLDTIYECGSMPISWQRRDRKWSYNFDEITYFVEHEQKEKVSAFNKVIQSCNDLNIDLIVVFPPVFKVHSKAFTSRIIKLGGDYPNYYLYNSDNPIYKDKAYFYDESHLIWKGAEIFTDEIIEYLQELISEGTIVF